MDDVTRSSGRGRKKDLPDLSPEEQRKAMGLDGPEVQFAEAPPERPDEAGGAPVREPELEAYEARKKEG